MTTNPEWIQVDPERVLDALQEAIDKASRTEGGVFLDFSSVRRIDAGEVRALEALAHLASAKAIKVALRGVRVEVYKVLKLLKLTQSFGFE